MKIRTGDKVQIISGKDKGKTGKVVQSFPALRMVVVEGANIMIKHIKKSGKQPGQKLEFSAPLKVSKVMLIDPKTNKPTRAGFKMLKDGANVKKVRIAKKSGEVV